MRYLFSVITLFALGIFCTRAVETNQSSEVVLNKTLQSDIRLEVIKSKIPLTQEEIEKFKKSAEEIHIPNIFNKPNGHHLFEFYLMIAQNRKMVYSKDHYDVDMGPAFPTGLKVYDAALTNQTLYIVYQEGVNNFIQAINLENMNYPIAKEPMSYYRDMTSCGRTVISAQLVANTDEMPAIQVEYENGIKSLWVCKEGKWSESNAKIFGK